MRRFWWPGWDPGPEPHVPRVGRTCPGRSAARPLGSSFPRLFRRSFQSRAPRGQPSTTLPDQNPDNGRTVTSHEWTSETAVTERFDGRGGRSPRRLRTLLGPLLRRPAVRRFRGLRVRQAGRATVSPPGRRLLHHSRPAARTRLSRLHGVRLPRRRTAGHPAHVRRLDLARPAGPGGRDLLRVLDHAAAPGAALVSASGRPRRPARRRPTAGPPIGRPDGGAGEPAPGGAAAV